MTTTTTIPNIGTVQGANPLKALLGFGQSPWMDYIRRDLLTGGGLKKYIDDDGLRGMTSNPAIFEKAITGSTVYSDILNSPDANATFRMPATFSKRFTPSPNAVTATSAWKSLPISRATPRPPSKKRAASGSLSIAPMS
jgi:hypothetical protein